MEPPLKNEVNSTIKTAKYISTDDFNTVLKLLKQNKWKVTAEYFGYMDKGIDFDFYILQKNGEEILMAWDNWDEGSIKADEKYIKALEDELVTEFRYGEVKYFEEDFSRIKKSLFTYFWRKKFKF